MVLVVPSLLPVQMQAGGPGARGKRGKLEYSNMYVIQGIVLKRLSLDKAVDCVVLVWDRV